MISVAVGDGENWVRMEVDAAYSPDLADDMLRDAERSLRSSRVSRRVEQQEFGPRPPDDAG